MNDILNEALLPFKSDFLPYVRSMIHQISRTTSSIITAYANLLDAEHSEQEDRDLLADLRHHHDLILHSLTHEADILEMIGSNRQVETYYNFVDGNPVEVDKEHFAGLPDEAEEV